MSSDEPMEEFDREFSEIPDSLCWTCQRIGWECLCSMPVKPPEGAEYRTVNYDGIILRSVTSCKFHWYDGSNEEQEIEKVADDGMYDDKVKLRSDRRIERYNRMLKEGLISQMVYNLLIVKEGRV